MFIIHRGSSFTISSSTARPSATGGTPNPAQRSVATRQCKTGSNSHRNLSRMSTGSAASQDQFWRLITFMPRCVEDWHHFVSVRCAFTVSITTNTLRGIV